VSAAIAARPISEAANPAAIPWTHARLRPLAGGAVRQPELSIDKTRRAACAAGFRVFMSSPYVVFTHQSAIVAQI
jgi:hypothetical protein